MTKKGLTLFSIVFLIGLVSLSYGLDTSIYEKYYDKCKDVKVDTLGKNVNDIKECYDGYYQLRISPIARARDYTSKSFQNYKNTENEFENVQKQLRNQPWIILVDEKGNNPVVGFKHIKGFVYTKRDDCSTYSTTDTAYMYGMGEIQKIDDRWDKLNDNDKRILRGICGEEEEFERAIYLTLGNDAPKKIILHRNREEYRTDGKVEITASGIDAYYLNRKEECENTLNDGELKIVCDESIKKPIQTVYNFLDDPLNIHPAVVIHSLTGSDESEDKLMMKIDGNYVTSLTHSIEGLGPHMFEARGNFDQCKVNIRGTDGSAKTECPAVIGFTFDEEGTYEIDGIGYKDGNMVESFKIRLEVKAPELVDSDSDGISDIFDECEDTPEGVAINIHGCTDTDEDGISDKDDKCLNTPREYGFLNQDGCSDTQVDSDSDGVSDVDDQCSDTVDKRVDGTGCSDNQKIGLAKDMIDEGDLTFDSKEPFEFGEEEYYIKNGKLKIKSWWLDSTIDPNSEEGLKILKGMGNDYMKLKIYGPSKLVVGEEGSYYLSVAGKSSPIVANWDFDDNDLSVVGGTNGRDTITFKAKAQGYPTVSVTYKGKRYNHLVTVLEKPETEEVSIGIKDLKDGIYLWKDDDGNTHKCSRAAGVWDCPGDKKPTPATTIYDLKGKIVYQTDSAKKDEEVEELIEDVPIEQQEVTIIYDEAEELSDNYYFWSAGGLRRDCQFKDKKWQCDEYKIPPYEHVFYNLRGDKFMVKVFGVEESEPTEKLMIAIIGGGQDKDYELSPRKENKFFIFEGKAFEFTVNGVGGYDIDSASSCAERLHKDNVLNIKCEKDERLPVKVTLYLPDGKGQVIVMFEKEEKVGQEEIVEEEKQSASRCKEVEGFYCDEGYHCPDGENLFDNNHVRVPDCCFVECESDKELKTETAEEHILTIVGGGADGEYKLTPSEKGYIFAIQKREDFEVSIGGVNSFNIKPDTSCKDQDYNIVTSDVRIKCLKDDVMPVIIDMMVKDVNYVITFNSIANYVEKEEGTEKIKTEEPKISNGMWVWQTEDGQRNCPYNDGLWQCPANLRPKEGTVIVNVKGERITYKATDKEKAALGKEIPSVEEGTEEKEKEYWDKGEDNKEEVQDILPPDEANRIATGYLEQIKAIKIQIDEENQKVNSYEESTGWKDAEQYVDSAEKIDGLRNQIKDIITQIEALK